MNKYQEALERAKICGDNDCCDCKFNEICINDKKGWYGTLKELVDKATPKKPIINHICNEIEGDIDYGVCPICERPLGYAFNYCEDCGQALDWSDEDDK